jgi:hypothetical protein
VLPEGFTSVPDYGYYGWLFRSAFQPPLEAQYLPLTPVTALTSGCPHECFFRFILPGRSFRYAIVSTTLRLDSAMLAFLNHTNTIFICHNQFSKTEIFSNLVAFPDQHFFERKTIFRRLMDVGSKLPFQTSALHECGSGDPADLVLNPVKNPIPFPLVQSSLLSLV